MKLVDGTCTPLTATVVPQIAGNIVRKPIGNNKQDKYKHLFEMTRLADNFPTEEETSSIELLIGNDYYLYLVLMQRIEIQPGLYLLNSLFRWLLTEILENTKHRRDTDINLGMLTMLNGRGDLQDRGICVTTNRATKHGETRDVLKEKQSDKTTKLQYDIHAVTGEPDIVRHLVNMDCSVRSTSHKANRQVNTNIHDSTNSLLVQQKNTTDTQCRPEMRPRPNAKQLQTVDNLRNNSGTKRNNKEK